MASIRRPQSSTTPTRGRTIEKGEPGTRSVSKERLPSIRTFLTTRFGLVVTLCLSMACIGFVLFPRQQQEVKGLRSSKSSREGQCNIFLAPSSLKGVTALGIYTTRDISSDESIFADSDGPSIPVVDYWEGPLRKEREQWVNHFGEYWWVRGVPDHVAYEADSFGDIQINFGAFPNHHCILEVLNLRYPIPAYDDSLVNRYKDPGAGSFSYSMGRDFFVGRRNVKAGEELFLNYGYCSRNKDEDENDWRSTIPARKDFEDAAQIVRKFYTRYMLHNKDANQAVTIPDGTDPRVAALVPKWSSEVREMMRSDDPLIVSLAKRMTTTPRTTEWIRSNGLCMEHLATGKSKIPQAGHGAFAQHRIRKGEIIVPVPMLHIANRDVLSIYDRDGNNKGTQLLMNYCFGNSESSVLLCPLTNAILINHCSKRRKQCGPKGPNAEYRWSSGWQSTSDEWRKMSVEELGKQNERGISMEIVALRDIKPGEEVFMDYGVEWEEAWDKHVANWKPPPPLKSLDGKSEERFVTAKEANEKEVLDLLVSGNIRENADHPYLFTGCRYRTSGWDDDEAWDEPNADWKNLTDKELLKLYADDGSGYEGTYRNHYDNTYWPCSVLLQDEKGVYTVRIHQHRWMRQQKWDKTGLPRLLTDYPRSSIQYFVKPYASDQHLPGVFRHPIGIRDEIFPSQWKNRKN